MWTQEGISEVTFSEKKIRYSFIYDRIKVSTFYELSFIVEFQD